MKKWLPLIISLGLIALVIIILFSVQITIPVSTVETYIATETKQEPYVADATYVVSSTTHEQQLFSSNGFSDYIGGDRSAVGTVYRFNSSNYNVGALLSGEVPLPPSQGSLDANRLQVKVDLGGGVFYFQNRICAAGLPGSINNVKIVLEWQTAGGEDVTAVVFYMDKATPASFENDQAMVAFAQSITPVLQTATSGKIEYSPVEGRPFFIGLHSSQSHPDAVHCSFHATYQWDEVVTGTRSIIKYRDVPVQVEKQRTVTKNQQISLLQAIFAKR